MAARVTGRRGRLERWPSRAGGATNGGREVGPELDSRRRVLAVRSLDDSRDARDRAQLGGPLARLPFRP